MSVSRSAFPSALVELALLLCALSWGVAAAALPTRLVASTESTSDGSGAAPYRTSPSFLLFALVSLLVGLALLLAGHRLWHISTALGAGLLVEFVVWVILANELPHEGFSRASSGSTGIIVWAVVTAGGLVGLVIGAVWWRIRAVAMGVVAGMALGLSIALMGDAALPPLARWILIGVLTGVATVVLSLTANWFEMIVATSIAGSFLFFLGVDLLVNEISGWSQGLLASYRPPVTSRILLGISCAAAIFGIAFQTWLFVYRQQEPFVRGPFPMKSRSTPAPASEPEESPDFASDYRLPPVHVGLGSRMSFNETFTNDSQASRDSVQERYRQAVLEADRISPEPVPLTPDSRFKSPLLPPETLSRISAIQHARDLSHPYEPPTRPVSVVSSTFAAGLRSRPPTFFNELLPHATRSATPPIPLVAPPILPLPATTKTGFATHDPTVVVASPNPPASFYPSRLSRPSILTSVPVGPESDDGTILRVVYPGGETGEAFLAGLTSGGAASLPATAQTPSSGAEDISTLLGGKFDLTPPPFTRAFLMSSSTSALDIPSDVTVSHVPTAGPSGESEAETFETAARDDSVHSRVDGWQDFPATPTSVRGNTLARLHFVEGERHKPGEETEELRLDA